MAVPDAAAFTQVRANGLAFAVDDRGPRDAPVILLVMGLGTQAIAWPEPLIAGLLAQGFRVIRYDNRDIGESTHLHATPAPHPLVYLAAAKLGLRPRIAYQLSDMADDAVALLDGGLQAWQAASGAMTDLLPTLEPRAFVARPQDLKVHADYVLERLETPHMRLVDARGADRFRGENETIDPVAGHIPGAVNRCFKDNLLPDGRFKPAAQLRAEWLALLAGSPPDLVVHQCGSGVSACLNMVAMEIAGLPGSRLYAGSWSEWCADPGRPVAC